MSYRKHIRFTPDSWPLSREEIALRNRAATIFVGISFITPLILLAAGLVIYFLFVA